MALEMIIITREEKAELQELIDKVCAIDEDVIHFEEYGHEYSIAHKRIADILGLEVRDD